MLKLLRYFYFFGPAARLIWRLMLDRRVALPSKALPLLALAYVVTPVDVIPDFIPIRGQLDDLLVAALLLGLFVIAAPWRVVLEHASGRPAEPQDSFSGTTIESDYRVEDDDAR